jgi:bifunctional UDP-N-acetylglucosamine pyrophosphorylase/glucosamine-1-phosphate N-acetyltransferase
LDGALLKGFHSGMTIRKCIAVILAAGEGTRMKSNTPKVLHEIAGRSMVGHVVDTVKRAGISNIAVVIGPGRDDVAAVIRGLAPDAECFVQAERLGTAHAALAARTAIGTGYDDVLVLFADTPLLEPSTIEAMRGRLVEGNAVVALGFEAKNPHGYGRLLTQGSALLAIREHKDASESEREVSLCNSGLLALDGKMALKLLDAVGNTNAQKEFYLTDVVALARESGVSTAYELADESEVMGVNDRIQLAAAEYVMQNRLRRKAMLNGATLIDPNSVFFAHDTVIGRDVVIEPQVVFGPKVVVGDHVNIHAFCHIEESTIASDASIGPFARIRPGSTIGEGAKIGNFVELKKAEIEAGAKISHLSYIGDAFVGANANIGAGTITCNYDGYFKYKTTIGEGAFIGANSSLVAPITIGAGAYVGSGSVITKEVAPDQLAVARGKQMAKDGWGALFRQASEAKKKAGKPS